MDSIVQLIRNGLCCIKDLDLFRESLPFLYDPKVTNSFLTRLPEPLDQTTPLEVMISMGQLYAFSSCTRSGWNMLTTSYGKVRRIDRLIKTRSPATNDADRIINESLVKEGKYALRSSFIGFLVALIGTSFFWLSANSWHITETDWIGGLPALIHALTLAEVCLMVLLYYMWKDAGEQMAKAARMQRLAKVLQDGTLTAKEVGLPSFEALTKWVPFWDAGVDVMAADPEPKEEEKLVVKEQVKVLQSLRDLVGIKMSDKKKDDVDEKEKDEEQLRRKRQQEKAQELLEASQMTRWEGYREYLYFVLNAIAFYGYMLSIVAYYFDNEETKHHTVRYVMFHLESHAADWHGNFAGDLMWTIEPIIVFSSPVLFSLMKPQPKKVKSE
mmetsp:Transcript_5296/g.10462  ORF Transcript_5296/g.10462 Transcript_5296/m.10462 type:complete len:384 (-) Transcript_5296:64-1215(-)